MTFTQFKTKFAALTHTTWFTALLLVASSLCIGLLSLCFASFENRWAMLGTYLSNPWITLLNLLPPVLLCFFLWFLTNRAVVAYGVTAGVVFGLTMANWYKLAFRNDPLLFGDLLLVREAGNMLGRYSLFMTKSLALALVCILLGGVTVFFWGRGRFRPGWRRFAAAGALLALTVPLSFLYTNKNVYTSKTYNPELVRQWSATGTFVSKGFVYPFLYSIPTASEEVPEGYNKKEAEAVLAAYQDGTIPEDQRVDIIGVMLEAYNDFSKYDEIPFVQDPYADYHALEAESVTGNLVTNIFAGGTVETERAFVTGFSDMSSFRSKTNSYAWYLKSQGYQTTGSHGSYGWFYNRFNINPNLGLDYYLFYENHYSALAQAGTMTRDDVMFPEMARLYQEAVQVDPAPYFSFSVTYQGHGPYNTQSNDWGQQFVQPGYFTAESENILNNYFGSVDSTGRELAAFVDSFREQERPVVLVVFGDHNPWLGEGNSVYHEIGMDLDQRYKTGFENYYGTRYLIWANDAAKEVLGESFVGEGPEISPCFLMTEVFDLCGWEGPAYMQYTRDVMEELPVIRKGGSRCITAEGEFIASPEGETAEKIGEFLRVQYYTRHSGVPPLASRVAGQSNALLR